jgi:signal transduction histidine kinase
MENSIKLMRGALSAAYRQLNMISDLLDLGRMEINQYELNIQPTNIVAVVSQALEDETFAITTKKLNLEKQFPNQPILVRADAELLHRVVSALVDNAVKFTVREDILRVTIRQEGDKVSLTFADNGRFISPEFEKQVVKRSPQWEWRQAGTRTSVGMGLPFCYAVALAHGGDFTAHSDVQTNMTRFTLTLPLHND